MTRRTLQIPALWFVTGAALVVALLVVAGCGWAGIFRSDSESSTVPLR